MATISQWLLDAQGKRERPALYRDDFAAKACQRRRFHDGAFYTGFLRACMSEIYDIEHEEARAVVKARKEEADEKAKKTEAEKKAKDESEARAQVEPEITAQNITSNEAIATARQFETETELKQREAGNWAGTEEVTQGDVVGKAVVETTES